MSDKGYNSRRTAFPNMWIKGIKVESPPFDEDGVVQEFVGRGITQEFEPLKQAGALTKRNIGDKVRNRQDEFGILSDTYRVSYHFVVRVPVGNPFSERGVSARARTWTRIKNPFEPDVIEVSTPYKDNDLSDRGPGDVYRVTTTVRK